MRNRLRMLMGMETTNTNRKAFDLTPAELENSPLSRLCEAAGYSSLKSMLNANNMWAASLAEVEAFLTPLPEIETKVRAHLAARSDEALADIRSGNWDEVMTDALYAAVGAQTPEAMRLARHTAEEICRSETKKTAARIIENGNGLPGIGDLCYDGESVYRIIAWDGNSRVSTNGPGVGNSVDVVLEYVGDASDVSEDEWSSIESKNCRVDIAE